jgi:hypothetical protein
MDQSNEITGRVGWLHLLGQGRGSQKDVVFRPGEILKGTVIGRLRDGRFMVVAKGRPFEAVSNLNLIQGDRRLFQVQSDEGRIALKLLDEELPRLQASSHRTGIPTTRIRSRIITTLSELVKAQRFRGLAPGVSAALKDLNQLFPAIVFRAPGKEDSGWLLQNLLTGGLFWENKVARFLSGGKKAAWNRIAARDLKGSLIALGRQISSAEGNQQTDAALRLKVEQCLELIEKDQFLNLSSVREGLGWLWFIPGSEEFGFHGGEVLVPTRQKGAGIRFALRADLSRLGELEAAVTVINRKVDVRISLQDTETVQLVTQNLNLLAQGLKRAGLIPGSIGCELRVETSSGSAPGEREGFEGAAIDLVL